MFKKLFKKWITSFRTNRLVFQDSDSNVESQKTEDEKVDETAATESTEQALDSASETTGETATQASSDTDTLATELASEMATESVSTMSTADFYNKPPEVRREMVTNISVGQPPTTGMKVRVDFHGNRDLQRHIAIPDLFEDVPGLVSVYFGNTEFTRRGNGYFKGSEYGFIVTDTEFSLGKIDQEYTPEKRFTEVFGSVEMPATDNDQEFLALGKKFTLDPQFIKAVSEVYNLEEFTDRNFRCRCIENALQKYEVQTGQTALTETGGKKHYTAESLSFILNRMNDLFASYVGIDKTSAQSIVKQYNELHGTNLEYIVPTAPINSSYTAKYFQSFTPKFELNPEKYNDPNTGYFASNYLGSNLQKFKDNNTAYRNKVASKFKNKSYPGYYKEYNLNGPFSPDELTWTSRSGNLPVPMPKHKREIVPMKWKDAKEYYVDLMGWYAPDWKVRTELWGKKLKTNIVLACMLKEAEYRCRNLGMKEEDLQYKISINNTSKSKAKGKPTYHGLAMAVDFYDNHDDNAEGHTHNWLGKPEEVAWNIPIALIGTLQDLGFGSGIYYANSRSDGNSDPMHFEYRGSIPDAMASLTSPEAIAMAESFTVPGTSINLMQFGAQMES